MDTEVVDIHLSRAVSLLDSEPQQLPRQELIKELHICEQELVAGRFVRRSNPTLGRTVVVRVPGVDSALIHIGHAMTLIDRGGSPEEARQDLQEAREHVAQISA